MWYSPVIWHVIRGESLLALRFSAPISCARYIPAMRASYSSWLLLALNSNLSDCSMKRSPGPSKTIPAPLPIKLDEPSTDNNNTWGASSCIGNVSSTKKSARTWDLILPWWVKPQVHGSTDVVKREYRSNREYFNSIKFCWWLEKSSVVKFGFLTVENNDKKRLGIIGSSWWQTLHKQTLKLNFILDLLSKDKFLLSVSKFLSKSLSVFL